MSKAFTIFLGIGRGRGIGTQASGARKVRAGYDLTFVLMNLVVAFTNGGSYLLMH